MTGSSPAGPQRPGPGRSGRSGAGLAHVVVVGASLAGLLAARAVRPYADLVTLVDRDRLPADPVARGGVPQSRHVHGLLARGREVVEDLFPGTTRDLVARGALVRDAQLDARFRLGGSTLAAGVSGLEILAVSRPLLEWYLRGRLTADPGVEVLDHTSVLDLVLAPDDTADRAADRAAGRGADRAVDGERVSGVLVSDRDGGPEVRLPADLVVDASGRASRTPEWLERRGYAAPPEEVRRVDKHYATRLFRRPTGASPFLIAISDAPGSGRGGVLVTQEGDRCLLGLTGRGRDRPPVGIDGFLDFARSLGVPELDRVLGDAEPLDDGATYRFPANRRRRYERLAHLPGGLVVTGDALCAFDPVFGQGMSVAALEAVELGAALRAALDRSGRGQTPGLAADFHTRAAAVVDNPWTIAAGGVPDAEGRVPRGDRLVGAYLRRLAAAAAADPELSRRFLRVNHLVDGPRVLLRPGTVLRVARGATRRTVAPWRTAPSPLPSGTGS